MLERAIEPKTYPMPTFEPLKAQKQILKNGIPVFALHNPDMQLVRLDVRIKAGSFFQQKPAVASAVGKLLTEGTKQFTAEQIAEKMDYAGTYLDVITERDFASLSIYFPANVTQNILPLLSHILTDSIFPQEKLEIFINRQKQRLSVQLEKTEYLSYRSFTEALFGATHPYGISLKINDLDNLTVKDLQTFHQKYYHAGNMRIFVAGNIDMNLSEQLESTFGTINRFDGAEFEYYEPNCEGEKILYTPKSNAVQSSICIGKRLFDRRHPQWNKMLILNAVLGGYFGSRLMTNIREEKGLTYGIYSRIQSFMTDGYLAICADVNKKLRKKALIEIYAELEKLCTTPIDENELKLVKNYLYGSLLRGFDGVFSQIDKIQRADDFHLSDNYLDNYLETIAQIQPADLLSMAQKYLQKESMYEIAVG
ncbi:MAG: insulinase family protein [Bacteroidales bacterium]|jgi:predicted Zn-dependent peptidase|nr:insulinase family protein [Bacteroidales bacterium]